MLRAVRKQEQDETIVTLSAADPLNLAGIVTPGDKVSALAGNRILYQGGEPLAVLSGKETRFLKPVEDRKQWAVKTRLVRRHPLADPS